MAKAMRQLGEMEAVQNQYLRYNKYLLTIIGQWPQQSNYERIIVTGIFAPIVIAQAVLQLGGVIFAWKHSDIDLVMEGFAPFLISLMCLCKFVNCIFNYDQMKRLFDTMLDDWTALSKVSSEFNTLCRSYTTARKVTLYYAASLYGTMTSFLVVPTMLTAADAIGLYNISGERPLAFRVDHFVDPVKYYYVLLIHSYFGTLGFVTIVVGIDCMTLFYIQHECGLCEILGRRLRVFAEKTTDDVELHPLEEEDYPYMKVRECVILHKHILAYAKDLEDANSLTNFFQLGLNMIGISFTLFQAVMKMENPNESLRYIMFSICLLSVVLLGTWPGQQLTDYSSRIFEDTTSGEWYKSSINARRLLNIMLLRSYTPIKLTAGKLYVLNLENFSAVVRRSFSYFTVLCSLQ